MSDKSASKRGGSLHEHATHRQGTCGVVTLLVIASAFAAPISAQHLESQDIPSLIGQLKDEDESIRTAAGRRLTAIGGDAVPGLVDVLRDGDPRARNYAIVLLGLIGKPAVSTLAASLRDADVNVRSGAARALERTETKPIDAIPALVQATRDAHPEVRASAIRALGKIGPPAASSVSALVEALKDESDQVKVDAAEALGLIGDEARNAIPALLAALNENSDMKSVAAFALFRIDRANQHVIAAVLGLLADNDRNVRGSAAFVLSQAGEGALPFLIESLSDDRATVRAGSAYALSLLGKISAPAAGHLARLLADRDEDVRANAADALGEMGPHAMASLNQLILALGDAIPIVRANAARALGTIGPDASPAIERLIEGLEDPFPMVREAAVLALAQISPATGPVLLETLETYDELISPSIIAAALARIAAALQKASGKMSDRELADAIALLQRFEQGIQTRAPAATDALDDIGRVLATLTTESSRRKASSERVVAYAAAALIAGILAIVLTVLGSFHVRRRALALIGRRWALVTGQCDGVVEVLRGAALVRPLFASQSTAVGMELSTWPPRAEDVDATRRLFKKGWNIKVIVERPRFTQLWAHAIGNQWADGADAIIAGQICFAASGAGVRIPPAQKNIAFAGLACARSPGMTPLFAPEDEIAAVARCHRRWRADVRPNALDATTEDLRDSLLVADIVHIAAHASVTGVHLRNGFLAGDDLDADLLSRMRCRLLVLSACDAGRMDGDDSFVHRLVESGVNIVAAVSPVRDQICRTFFEEFYSALLPSRRVEGVHIGTAIRAAVTRCALRVQKLEELGMPVQATRRWKDSVNSLVLYGDPSSHFVLR